MLGGGSFKLYIYSHPQGPDFEDSFLEAARMILHEFIYFYSWERVE
jgi:hypothetical protein